MRQVGAGGGGVEDASGPRATENLRGESTGDPAMAGASDDEDLVDADGLDEDNDPDLVDIMPQASKSKRVAGPGRRRGAAAQRQRNTDQRDDDIEILRAAFAELVECKRILDQVD